jgi:hypothetical protein
MGMWTNEGNEGGEENCGKRNVLKDFILKMVEKESLQNQRNHNSLFKTSLSFLRKKHIATGTHCDRNTITVTPNLI